MMSMNSHQSRKKLKITAEMAAEDSFRYGLWEDWGTLQPRDEVCFWYKYILCKDFPSYKKDDHKYKKAYNKRIALLKETFMEETTSSRFKLEWTSKGIGVFAREDLQIVRGDNKDYDARQLFAKYQRLVAGIDWSIGMVTLPKSTVGRPKLVVEKGKIKLLSKNINSNTTTQITSVSLVGPFNFINHACDECAQLEWKEDHDDEYYIISMIKCSIKKGRIIKKGEEVFINYNSSKTTKYKKNIFPCGCSGLHCCMLKTTADRIIFEEKRMKEDNNNNNNNMELPTNVRDDTSIYYAEQNVVKPTTTTTTNRTNRTIQHHKSNNLLNNNNNNDGDDNNNVVINKAVGNCIIDLLDEDDNDDEDEGQSSRASVDDNTTIKTALKNSIIDLLEDDDDDDDDDEEEQSDKKEGNDENGIVESALMDSIELDDNADDNEYKQQASALGADDNASRNDKHSNDGTRMQNGTLLLENGNNNDKNEEEKESRTTNTKSVNDANEYADTADDEEEIVIVGGSLENSIDLLEEEDDDDEDDEEEKSPDEDGIQIIRSKGKNALSDFPHSRSDCVTNLFTIDPHKFCPQCYCYVCDVKAIECTKWDNHCEAQGKELKWKQRHCNARSKRNCTKRKSTERELQRLNTWTSSLQTDLPTRRVRRNVERLNII